MKISLRNKVGLLFTEINSQNKTWNEEHAMLLQEKESIFFITS